MRAPIEPGRPGWDPDAGQDRGAKVGAILRGASFFAIAIAFLFVSQRFITADTDEDKPASAAATVYMAVDLRPVITELETGASLRYDRSAALKERLAGGAKADVFVGVRSDAQALLDDGICSEPAAIATAPAEYAGCLIAKPGSNTTAGAAFLKQLTGLSGRDALLQHGFSLPPR